MTFYDPDELFGTGRQVGESALGVPFAAVVTQSGANGVWCTRSGEDSRQSLGPVQNPSRDVIRPTPDGHTHERENLPNGTPVVLVNTSLGLWVIAHGG